MPIIIDKPEAKFLVRLADTELVLAQRLCEMCSNGPFLEEDIALSNIALDLIGRAEQLYLLVAEVEGKGLSADDYAYRRNEREYFSMKLVELPNTDFAWVIVRQYLHDVYMQELFSQLQKSEIQKLSGLAEKVLKEIRYSLIHAHDWMQRLGIGTPESNQRTQNALNHFYKYVHEMFAFDQLDGKFIPDTQSLEKIWLSAVALTLSESNLQQPEIRKIYQHDYRNGFHTEYLGHLLSEMQFLPRAYPDAKW
ncbi:MAG: phenylacetate-CoA oxygenase subunit PaaC [Crocinitomicaceae bacterium]|nr:phenylacetate-CoA oxygenase subunit PaaC [Crocinitomicaceae bacterium]